MRTLQEIRTQLTGPGGPFEIVEEEVLGERMQVLKNRTRSLRELLEKSRVNGDREYVVHGDRRITYAEHARLVASVAAALRERHGIGPGDRVAILAANCIEWILGFWATVSLGGIVAALNGWWAGDEILYGVANSDPKLLIGDRDRLARVKGHDLGVPVLEIEAGFAELERFAPGAELPSQPIAEDDPAVILYTSGTTGRPKGAMASHRGICGFVQTAVLTGVERMLLAVEQKLPRDENPLQTCTILTAPLFHLSGLYGFTVMMLAAGGKMVLRSGRFDPEDVLRLIEKERITTFTAMGNTGLRVATHPAVEKYDLSSMRNVGFGGAPTSPSVQDRLRKVFPTARHSFGMGYGSSESVGVAAGIGGLEYEQFPTSTGGIVPTNQVEIRDPEGKPLPEGVEGEIHIRSPYVILEYWRNPEATRQTILPSRWLRTGDIGHFEDGRLYINSRARDMILRGGENIYPVEIEQRLEAHPSVAEAAVVGSDHPIWGQEVKAIVVPFRGAAIDTDELARWVGETLAAFKVPSLWEVRREPLPRNASGKVLKNVLTGEAENQFVGE